MQRRFGYSSQARRSAVLTSALCEALPSSVRRVEIDAFELHPTLADLCEETLSYAARWLEDRGVECTFTVHRKDFVLANAARLTAQLFEASREAYDIAISNPPYFKLQKRDLAPSQLRRSCTDPVNGRDPSGESCETANAAGFWDWRSAVVPLL